MIDLDSLLTRDPAHPSELALDEWIAGLLSAERAAEIDAHCAGCGQCAAFVAERRQGLAAVPEIDADAAFGRIWADVEAAGAPPAPASWWARFKARFGAGSLGLVLLGAAAAVVAMLATREPDPSGGLTGPEVVRAKGTLALEVARKTPDGVQPMVSGDVFRPDDEIRFLATLPDRGRIAIIGIEPNGTLYTAWPLPGHAADPVRPKGKAQGLPGAVRLDGEPGTETLHLVFCPEAVEPVCTSAGATATPTCPTGCRTAPFVVNKQL